MLNSDLAKTGAFNLFQNCLDVQSEDHVVLVCEDPKHGWYDQQLATHLKSVLASLNVKTTIIQVGGPGDCLPETYHAALESNCITIFLARIGDQIRFSNKLRNKKVAMVYARDLETFATDYTATPHAAMSDLKVAIDEIISSSSHVSITCPLGTDLECAVVNAPCWETDEVHIRRFPLNVPKPVLANRARGKVALAGWLTPTGSQTYSPPNCEFKSVVFAHIENGRIQKFDGESDCVNAIENHYDQVASRLNIEKDVVHSWHAGIHPACFYPGSISDDPDRWSNTIFGNPRYLHFHTCGNYPPGEICWMVLDPTIKVDGTALWEDGQLMPQNFPGTAAIMQRWPQLSCLFEHPEQRLGLRNTI